MWAHSFDNKGRANRAEPELSHLASRGWLPPWISKRMPQQAPAHASLGQTTDRASPVPTEVPWPCSARPGPGGGGGRCPRWAGSGDKSDIRGSSPLASVKGDQAFCHLATRFIDVNLYLSLVLFFQGLFMVQSRRQCRSFLHSPPPSYLWQSVTLERGNLREEIHW